MYIHVCVHGRSMDVLVTVPSADTRVWYMYNVRVHGRSIDLVCNNFIL